MALVKKSITVTDRQEQWIRALYGIFLYAVFLLTMGGIYAVLTLGLNIQWGVSPGSSTPGWRASSRSAPTPPRS